MMRAALISLDSFQSITECQQKYFIPGEVEQSHGQVTNEGGGDLLVRDGVGHVARADEDWHSAQQRNLPEFSLDQLEEENLTLLRSSLKLNFSFSTNFSHCLGSRSLEP